VRAVGSLNNGVAHQCKGKGKGKRWFV